MQNLPSVDKQNIFEPRKHYLSLGHPDITQFNIKIVETFGVSFDSVISDLQRDLFLVLFRVEVIKSQKAKYNSIKHK